MKRLSLSLFAVLAVGCAAARPKPLQAHPAGEADLEWLAAPAEAAVAFAREVGDYGEWHAKSNDGRYSATGTNSGPDQSHSLSFIKESSGPDRIELDLLPDDPLKCTLEPTRIEAAQRLEKLLDEVKKQGVLQAAAAVGVRAVGGYPLLFADAIYLKKAAGQTTVSERKLAVFTRPGFALTCEHDGAGLRGAFERAVRLMAETLRDARQAPLPPRRFGLMRTRRAGGKLIGYSEEEISPLAADGTFRRDGHDVDLNPSAAGPGFTGNEEIRIEKRAADGRLLQGNYVVVVSGGRFTASLTAQADGSFALEGLYDKPFTGKLQPANQFQLQSGADLLGLVQGKKETIDDDSFDLSEPRQVTRYTLRSGKDGRTLIIEREGRALARAKIDERGAMVSTTSTDGTYETRLLWTEGAPP